MILEVVLATFIIMVLGWLWYSPLLFGNQWIKLIGSKKVNGGKKEMMIHAILTLAQMIVLWYMIQWTSSFSVLQALTIAALLWLGFTSVAQLGPMLWEKKHITLFYINTGYSLLSILIGSIVMVLI